ncbi:hypothetical protein BH23BAC1_BH23BAC1_17650 [soil metagenome]
MAYFPDSPKFTPKVYSITCGVCGMEFISKKSFAKYCSLSCKSKNQKLNKNSTSDPLLFFSKKTLPDNISKKIKNWRNIPGNKKVIVLRNASKALALEKLKELGYPEYLAVKPVAFSDDDKLMITVNIIQQYAIEMLKS